MLRKKLAVMLATAMIVVMVAAPAWAARATVRVSGKAVAVETSPTSTTEPRPARVAGL